MCEDIEVIHLARMAIVVALNRTSVFRWFRFDKHIENSPVIRMKMLRRIIN